MNLIEPATPYNDKEFLYTPADFERIKALIYKKAGIALTPSKVQMVYSRISRRVRKLGLKSFASYLDLLDKGRDNEEMESFINALTTNLTHFFREPHHFAILHEHLKTCAQPITIWCSACSTGEEAYSIAMVACEAFNTLRPPVRIIASDIDTNALATAERAVYTVEQTDKELTQERLRRFFQKGTEENHGSVRIRHEIKQLITFRQENLIAPPWSFNTRFDAIFCRNVMIYFDKSTQVKVLDAFTPLLKPDGLLFAGHSENFSQLSKQLQLRGKTVYSLARA